VDEAGLHETGMETAIITHVCVLKITMLFRFFYDPKVKSLLCYECVQNVGPMFLEKPVSSYDSKKVILAPFFNTVSVT
jgi:hypothetical protein